MNKIIYKKFKEDVNMYKKNSDNNNVMRNNKINENIMEDYLNLNIPNIKPIYKITDRDFTILRLENYNEVLTVNYNMQQLKKICKHYKLKISGNKVELKKRLYNYFYYTYYSIKIQKHIRKVLLKNYLYLHGPGFIDRKLCTNDVDFCTLDSLNVIPYYQFFSFMDEDGFIYGYDIKSLYNLYLKNKITVENPFNKKIIDNSILTNIIKYIKYSKLLKFPINIDYDDNISNLSDTRQLELNTIALFQTIDSYGNYTNASWFLNLNRYELIMFIRELIDIWNYRANLSHEIKREIIPILGSPFLYNHNVNSYNMHQHNLYQVRKYCLSVIDLFINRGINQESKSLGAYYILSALTLVSSEAAETLPWLYQAVAHE
jgi:hypothetical protein